MKLLRKSLLILLVGLTAPRVSADVNVLIIGSTSDSGDSFGGSSDPFSVAECFATGITCLGHGTRCCKLVGWYHRPFPSGAEGTRWVNLRNEGGTDWDYIILVGEPYTPGMYALAPAGDSEDQARMCFKFIDGIH